MKRTFVVAVMIIVLVMATAATAFAGFTWCLTDPNIQLPDGRGVAHLIVGVPEEYQGAQVTVKVWAPAGSEVVGNSSKNVTVELHTGSDNLLVAKTKGGVPVQLSVEYRGDQLETFTFEKGTGTAEWPLQ